MRKKVFEDMEFTVISSKGQLVIPKDIREEMNIKSGNVMAVSVSPNKDMLLLKKIKNPMTEEDVVILKEVESAWKEVECGKTTKKSKKEFLEEMKTW
jgi:AbrB family looped-hinge helix DNA binding protein